jgi:hypothetical protein
MSEINIFKRKTKVIDDDDNMDIEAPQTTTKKIENIKVIETNYKKQEENKSGNIHTVYIKKNIPTKEQSSKEKNELIQSNEIKKPSTQENLTKPKETQIKEAIKKSVDKNNINSVKPNPLDKIKKAINISSSTEKKKSAPVEKQVSLCIKIITNY